VFALNQIAVTSWGIAQINYVLELCGPERTATYSAVAGLLIGPFRAAAPLFGARLVDAGGYRSMFGLSAAVTLMALAMSLRWVLEPRGQAFRLGTRAAGGGVQAFGTGKVKDVSVLVDPERLNA
jgi:fructose-specific phosphotransferase system IIC component